MLKGTEISYIIIHVYTNSISVFNLSQEGDDGSFTICRITVLAPTRVNVASVQGAVTQVTPEVAGSQPVGGGGVHVRPVQRSVVGKVRAVRIER